jgi:hypothetical protein
VTDVSAGRGALRRRSGGSDAEPSARPKPAREERDAARDGAVDAARSLKLRDGAPSPPSSRDAIATPKTGRSAGRDRAPASDCHVITCC